MKKKETKPTPKIVPKNVRHNFSDIEKVGLGNDLAGQICKAQTLEKELDEVKAQFKAKQAECDARINSISNSLRAGFEMRVKDCVVEFRPKDRQKDYFLAVQKDEQIEKGDHVGTEPMTQDDFQQDLLNAEAAFECRKSIDLFPPTTTDYGCLLVGRNGGKWYAALRIKISDQASLEEPMNCDGKAFIQRQDAIVMAGKRAMKWFKSALDVVTAKGFEDSIRAAVESQAQIVE